MKVLFMVVRLEAVAEAVADRFASWAYINHRLSFASMIYEPHADGYACYLISGFNDPATMNVVRDGFTSSLLYSKEA